MKKNEKLYVARYVPYANRVRNGRIFVLKTALITLLICLILVFVGVFATSKIPKKFYSSIFKPQSKTVQTVKKEDEEKGFVYPKPTDTVRQKADRLRELNLEEWNVNHYTPSDGELDNVYLYDDKKMCYLTFDDGPKKDTPELLDALEALDVPATFFLVGLGVRAFPEYARQIVQAGHAVGCHTMGHAAGAIKKDEDFVLRALQQDDERGDRAGVFDRSVPLSRRQFELQGAHQGEGAGRGLRLV